jgi:hypothetical protein
MKIIYTMSKNKQGKKKNVPNHSTMMKEFLGHKIRVPHTPPEFTPVPWYPLTVRIANPPAQITYTVLRSSIQSQLGFTSSYVLDVRLQRVMLWGALVTPNGTSFLNPVTLAVLDPIRIAGAEVLEVLTDYPNQVSRACVGYQYSIAQRNVTIRLDVGTTLYRCEGVGPGAIMYVRLFWRSPNIAVQSIPEQQQEYEFVDTVSQNNWYQQHRK